MDGFSLQHTQALKDAFPADRLFFREPMHKHTSFRIGGPADALFIAATSEDVVCALKLCRQLNLPLTLMGNGTNMLVGDKGIRGLVLKIYDRMDDPAREGTKIHAKAGQLLTRVSAYALAESLTGLEFASGIPGTLGGGLCMNAGAYGGEMAQIVESVTAVDKSGNTYTLQNHELDFGYRTSRLQKEGLVAVSAILALAPGDKAAMQATVADYTHRRRSKQPLAQPSAGSVFKRPPGQFAGDLIERAGLKGKTLGGAQVSPMHANFIVNTGHATAKDVLDLIAHVQETVQARFNVWLEPEIRLIGEQ